MGLQQHCATIFKTLQRNPDYSSVFGVAGDREGMVSKKDPLSITNFRAFGRREVHVPFFFF